MEPPHKFWSAGCLPHIPVLRTMGERTLLFSFGYHCHMSNCRQTTLSTVPSIHPLHNTLIVSRPLSQIHKCCYYLDKVANCKFLFLLMRLSSSSPRIAQESYFLYGSVVLHRKSDCTRSSQTSRARNNQLFGKQLESYIKPTLYYHGTFSAKIIIILHAHN